MKGEPDDEYPQDIKMLGHILHVWVTPRLIRKCVSRSMGQDSLRGVRVSQNPLFVITRGLNPGFRVFWVPMV